MIEFVIDQTCDDGGEASFGLPAKSGLNLGGVPAKGGEFDFAEKGFLVIDVVFPMEASVREGGFDKVFHGMGFSGAEDIVVHRVVLEHLPETLHVFWSPTPVAPGVEAA